MNDILNSEFEKLKQDLILAYDAKGMRASGNFANSLSVEVLSNESNFIARLYGEDYSQQLETGRRGGTYPPIKSIEQWILQKGVFTQVLQEIKLKSLAFLIARKIYQQGWNRQGYGGVELISSVITDERLNDILYKIINLESSKVTSEIEFLINELV